MNNFACARPLIRAELSGEKGLALDMPSNEPIVHAKLLGEYEDVWFSFEIKAEIYMRGARKDTYLVNKLDLFSEESANTQMNCSIERERELIIWIWISVTLDLSCRTDQICSELISSAKRNTC